MRATVSEVRSALRLWRSRVELKNWLPRTQSPVRFASGLEACFEALGLSLGHANIHNNSNMGAEFLKSSALPRTLTEIHPWTPPVQYFPQPQAVKPETRKNAEILH